MDFGEALTQEAKAHEYPVRRIFLSTINLNLIDHLDPVADFL